MTGLSTRRDGRRPKSAKARNRGRGTDWAVSRAQLWGFGGVRATAEVGSEARRVAAMALQLGGDAFF
jgi:hypothetical protein